MGAMPIRAPIAMPIKPGKPRPDLISTERPTVQGGVPSPTLTKIPQKQKPPPPKKDGNKPK
jgi:hypothetical protein